MANWHELCLRQLTRLSMHEIPPHTSRTQQNKQTKINKTMINIIEKLRSNHTSAIQKTKLRTIISESEKPSISNRS